MTALFAVLLPILVVDAINPMLLGLLVMAAGTSRPIANSSAFLTGHTLAYFAAGVAAAFGLEQVTERLTHPQTVDFVIELIVGSLLLWAVIPAKKSPAPGKAAPVGALTPIRCLGLGALTNFVGVPFALPYFAAINQILKAELSLESSLFVLAIYNLAYALPFVAVPVLIAVTGDRCKPMLQRVNTFIMNLADRVMPWLLFLIGLALVGDGLFYFLARL